MAERIILDPNEVISSRVEVDITPWIRAEGIDWGDGDISAYMAEMSYGASPVDYRVPNRTVVVPLVLRAQGGTAFETIRLSIQSKTARFQQEGGVIKRITSGGSIYFADIVNATLTVAGGWAQAFKSYDVDAQLVLEARPDFYGNEIALTDRVETGLAELTWVEPTVNGDYPARVRMVVDEDQGQSQLGLMWCYRSRNYSGSATARMSYEAEALQPLDTATKAALTGASGGTVVTHGTLSTNWTPVLNLNLGGTAYLTHTGTYRMWCRYRTTSGTAVALRSVYDVGDFVFPEENDAWYHPEGTGGTALYTADLGELRLRQGPVGTHRWAGQIQGKGLAGGENVSIDRVWFQSVDESAGLLRAPIGAELGLSSFVARDEFNQSGGNLAGKVLPSGQTWTALAGSDPDDWTINTSEDVIQRTAIGPEGWRIVTAGTTAYAAIVVQAYITEASATAAPGSEPGVAARVVDINNYFAATIRAFNADQGAILDTRLLVGGVDIAMPEVRLWSLANGDFFVVRAMIDAAGRFYVWAFNAAGGSPGEPLLSGWRPQLATGGALDDGMIGVYDQDFSNFAHTTKLDNFAAWVPTSDAVLFASQSVELRTDGMFREDSTGSASGPVSWIEGDLPRLPVSGLEGRPVEVMVKPSRGDFARLPDTGIDDMSARLFYRPCWLQVPGS